LTSTGGTINTQSTVDGAYALTMNGAADIDAAIGATTALSAVTFNDTVDLGANISTTGNQTYQDAITLTGNTTLTSTGGTINTQSTIDGGYALTMTGAADIDAAIGTTSALSAVTFNDAVNLGGNVRSRGDIF
jgi:hypothetical protein